MAWARSVSAWSRAGWGDMDTAPIQSKRVSPDTLSRLTVPLKDKFGDRVPDALSRSSGLGLPRRFVEQSPPCATSPCDWERGKCR